MIDISGIVSRISQAASSAFTSSVWTAIVIVLLLFVVMLFLYPSRKDVPMAKYVRYLLYSFGIVLVCILLHSNALDTSIRTKYTNKNTVDFATNLDRHVREGALDIDVALKALESQKRATESHLNLPPLR